jgi:type I restriction enzyme R subunit
VAPLADPEFRARILSIRRKYDLPFDEHTQDVLISVEARTLDRDEARQTIEDWRAYLEENQDLIAALRVAFSDHRRDPRAVYAQLAGLARQIERPPHQWTPTLRWDAYRKLGIAHGNGGRKGVPELVSILRYELGLVPELHAYRSLVESRLANWLARQEQAGRRFTVDQRWFTDRIAHVIASRLHVVEDTLDDPPFTHNGGADGFCQAFGGYTDIQHLRDLLERRQRGCLGSGLDHLQVPHRDTGEGGDVDRALLAIDPVQADELAGGSGSR